jgi:hypothetical protein
MDIFRAAFQYGIKMSEGRKTRRFKETNDKAELDRQWKKISAVSETQIEGFSWEETLAYTSGTSRGLERHGNEIGSQVGLDHSMTTLTLFFWQIIEKRKKMEADG